MKPDTDAAKLFLNALDSAGDHLFQTFDDSAAKIEDLALVTRDFRRLAAMNDKGAGVFVTINSVKGNKRVAGQMSRVRALFADFDEPGTVPAEWPVEPSILVESSPGKFHAYWLVDGPFPHDEFKPAMRRLVQIFGSDPKVVDYVRVLRVPGFLHQKGEPFMVRLASMSGELFTHADLKEWLGFEAEKAPERVKFENKGVATDNPYLRVGVERALDAIATAPEGHRNHTLNSEAYGLFGFVKGGHLGEAEVREQVLNAARAAGLPDAEIMTTMASAWGAARSRDLPAPKERMPIRMPDRDDDHDGPEPEYADNGEMIEVREDVMYPDPDPEPTPETKPEPDDAPQRRGDNEIKFLGYNKEGYYYLPKGKGQVVGLRASEHTKLRMIELADLAYWQRLAGGKVTKESWDEFANAMMRRCEEVGIFDENRLRGRGAWVDGKRIVVHTGSEVHVGKDVVPLDQVKSHYIYEAQSPWDFGFGEAASTKEAHRLVDVFSRLTWRDKLSGALATGWCVIAPVSGALFWRSHVWITGPSGSGKSTVLDVIHRIVGPAALRADGKTSEAAIRQIMSHDARPVIMDEVESEDRAAVDRVQGLLDLARLASSGGTMSKGGANHKAVTFVMRSCFCFSSINTAVRHKADESRISRLTLVPNKSPNSDEHYKGIVSDIDAWFNENYASRMFARTIAHLPTLLKNCATFTTAAAIIFKSRRAADQIGPMLAGYYLCHKTDEISLERATEFIAENDWDDYLALSVDTDEMRMFQYIISRRLRINQNGGNVEVTIGTAIEEARMEPRGIHAQALGACGIKVDYNWIGISDSAENTRALFKDKPEWSADWKSPLRNIPGAMKSKDSERFLGGIKSRLTLIPYGHLDGTYQAREPGEDE